MPEIKKGEVLVRIKAAGVNRADILQRLGKYPPPPEATDIPGLEIAGTIEGNGERVCALLPGGGYAEYVNIPKELCIPIPESMNFIEAAALPEAVFTVWKNLFSHGRISNGETALVHGGSSGIGTMAIQMLKSFGTTVLVTAGTKEKCIACENLGADLAINYNEQDFVKKVMSFTEGKGADVVLDMVGGKYVSRNLECLAESGRHINIACIEGAKAEISIPLIMQKCLTLTGSTLRGLPTEKKAALTLQIAGNVWPKIVSGEIKPVIHETFPLELAYKAHEVMERGENIGKLILTV